MHRLDLRQLRLVAAVARHASLTRAANELCISQPSASRQLTELEDSLGLLLFSRTPKAMIATAAGAELLEHGNALLAAADALEQRMQRRARQGGGQLRIAIDKVHCDDWIAEVVPAFRASHANVELTLQRVPTCSTPCSSATSIWPSSAKRCRRPASPTSNCSVTRCS